VWPILFIAGLLVLSLLALAAASALRTRAGLRKLLRASDELARGDLSSRISTAGNRQISALAESLESLRHRQIGSTRAVHLNERVLEALLDQLAEGVVIGREDGRVLLVNTEAGRLLGVKAIPWDPNSDERRPILEEHIPHHELQRLLAWPQASAQDETPLTGSRVDESRLEIHTPRGPLVVIARASNIVLSDARNDFGKPAVPVRARMLLLTDVTDLTNAMRMRSDFAANASHELRTPLSAIRGAVQTLLEMDIGAEPKAAARFLQMVDRHSARLVALVSDLLELSRLESSEKKVEAVSLPVQRVCDDLRGRWAEAVSAKQLTWRADINADCQTVFANAHLLQVVLDNLVDNAVKFTPKGGTISLEARRVNSEVAISVRDTGCGIPAADHARVFERFYQVAKSRSEADGPERRGTGLGLSIVRHAVTAMGGEVRLESELQRGTRVTIALPANASPA
jgi:signal transduction histidine kinase/HAMP domain-containing protein